MSPSHTMAGIPVRIEPPAENTVMEVTYEGMEVVQPPLTMSENLSRLARKIDFIQDSEMEVEEEVAEEEEDDDEDHLKSFHQPGQSGSNSFVLWFGLLFVPHKQNNIYRMKVMIFKCDFCIFITYSKFCSNYLKTLITN